MRPFISLLASTLLVSSQAAILPIKFNFGSQTPTVFTIAQCAGHENDPLQFIEGQMDEVICMPGTTTMNTKTEIREDLPSDLMMKLDLKKIDPFPMTVPCLDGVGSCDYDICQIITDMGATVCDHFPEGQPCGCPLLQGGMDLQGIEMPVQDMGDVLGSVMEGGYEATARFYPASDPSIDIGCMEFTFTLQMC